MAEHLIPTKTKLIALGMYLCTNVILTLYNKLLLNSFNLPWLMTTIHAASTSLGTSTLLSQQKDKTTLSRSEKFRLFAFSTLFTVNIALSNASLSKVSIPFHQVIRATCPCMTVVIYRIFYSRTFPCATYVSLVPITLGIGIMTYGDYSFTRSGFVLTWLGVITAAWKTVLTNNIMTKTLKVSPLEFLHHISSTACLQSLIFAILSGEYAKTTTVNPYYDLGSCVITILKILGNGVLAFCLNISSFNANRLAGALTMTICALVKQCLAIVLGAVFFEVNISYLSAIGILITSLGTVMFSFAELQNRSNG